MDISEILNPKYPPAEQPPSPPNKPIDQADYGVTVLIIPAVIIIGFIPMATSVFVINRDNPYAKHDVIYNVTIPALLYLFMIGVAICIVQNLLLKLSYVKKERAYSIEYKKYQELFQAWKMREAVRQATIALLDAKRELYMAELDARNRLGKLDEDEKRRRNEEEQKRLRAQQYAGVVQEQKTHELFAQFNAAYAHVKYEAGLQGYAAEDDVRLIFMEALKHLPAFFAPEAGLLRRYAATDPRVAFVSHLLPPEPPYPAMPPPDDLELFNRDFYVRKRKTHELIEHLILAHMKAKLNCKLHNSNVKDSDILKAFVDQFPSLPQFKGPEAGLLRLRSQSPLVMAIQHLLPPKPQSLNSLPKYRHLAGLPDD